MEDLISWLTCKFNFLQGTLETTLFGPCVNDCYKCKEEGGIFIYVIVINTGENTNVYTYIYTYTKGNFCICMCMHAFVYMLNLCKNNNKIKFTPTWGWVPNLTFAFGFMRTYAWMSKYCIYVCSFCVYTRTRKYLHTYTFIFMVSVCWSWNTWKTG